MKRFLGILIALLLVFSGVVFAQQQTTKTLDDIDARIAALGTFSWSASAGARWGLYLDSSLATGVDAQGNTIYKPMWYFRAYEIFNHPSYTTRGALKISWSGVTLTHTIHFTSRLFEDAFTFSKNNVAIYLTTRNAFGTAANFTIRNIQLNISKIFDIASLQIGGRWINWTHYLYTGTYFNYWYDVYSYYGAFLFEGIDTTNLGNLTCNYVTYLSTFNLLNNNLTIQIMNRFYTNPGKSIVEQFGNDENTGLRIKYSLGDLGWVSFATKFGIPFTLDPKAVNPYGIAIAKMTPYNKYFLNVDLTPIENMELLVSVSAMTIPYIDQTNAIPVGTAANPTKIPYKTAIYIDPAIELYYALSDSLEIIAHVNFQMLTGVNSKSYFGVAWQTPAAGNTTYVASNYTESNAFLNGIGVVINKPNWAPDLFNAAIDVTYYMDKYTLNGSISYSNLAYDLSQLNGNTVQFYGWASTISLYLSAKYAISANSSITLAISYNIYLGIPSYSSNWSADWANEKVWLDWVSTKLDPRLTITFTYVGSF